MSDPGDKASKADHLKPYQWQKGQSGNPSGRPKDQPSIEAAMRRLLADGNSGQELVNALVMVAVKKALKGDHRFWNSILERVDGKVADRLAGADGEGLTVILEQVKNGGQVGDD